MEIIVPFNGEIDFEFNGARSSPSSPKGFGDYYLSAPTSPSNLKQLYRDFDDFLIVDDDEDKTECSVPFSWEVKPGKPKSPKNGGDFDFAFDVGGGSDESSSVSAEELFDGGMIKPSKPPSPRLARKRTQRRSSKDESLKSPERGRGREFERVSGLSSSSSRRGTRSLSPLRVSQCPWEETEENRGRGSAAAGEETEEDKQQQNKTTANSALTSSSSSKGLIKKWRLKDFFLFRSASEGRAADKDHLKKYTAAVVKGSSFRGINESYSGPISRRGGKQHNSKRHQMISAHELHYTFNRAVSEDLKKRTFLPYKQGILGKLAFNPAVHALSNGFGFSRK